MNIGQTIPIVNPPPVSPQTQSFVSSEPLMVYGVLELGAVLFAATDQNIIGGLLLVLGIGLGEVYNVPPFKGFAL